MRYRTICIGAGVLLSAVAGAAGSGESEVRLHAAAAAPADGAFHSIHGSFGMTPEQKSAAGYERMDNALAGIADHAATAPKTQLLGHLQTSTTGVRFSVQDPLQVPSVLVDIQVKGDPAALMRQLEQLGAERLSRYSNMVSGFIPSDRLKDAADLDGVRFMRASRAATRTGSVTTQGDYIQHSDLVRASTFLPGLTGAGVTVGILSDSFACTTAVKSYAQDVASGDLPAGVNVIEEYNATLAGVSSPTSSCQGATDEGRAIAQIVYDVAPGTKLSFYTAFSGEADFAHGIIALANAGATIIDDDVGYFDEPVFQDGIVAQAVDSVKARGIPYFSSAGNNARQSYEADFVDSGTVGATGADNAGEKLMGFTPTGGGTMQNWLPITVPAGFTEQSLQILEWDQPYVTGAPASGGATSQLDICLTDSTGKVIHTGCSGANLVGSDPVSINGFVTDGTTTAYGLQVGVVGGTPVPHHIKIIFADDGGGSQAATTFATYSPTVQGHPGAAGAAAVGAMYFRANPVCLPAVYPNYTLETFSSAGGDPVLFDFNGNKLATPVTRQKPLFVAPDGGNTTFFAQQLGARSNAIPQCSNAAGSWNFFGTSAAAPHAAGVAALLLQAVPGATPDQIYNALASTAILNMAVNVPRSGSTKVVQNAVNYDTGNGFIQADKALTALATRVLTVSPGTLSFGSQMVGSTSQPQKVTVSNSGTLPVAISGITASGPFTLGNGCPATLAPQASCQLLVSAAPTTMGAASGTVTISSNDSAGTDTVTLGATGVAPIATLSPLTLDFGSVLVGKAATTQAVTLSNSGTAALAIGGITTGGSSTFTQTNTCPASLASGASCTITVGFTPGAVQAYSGTVNVASNGGAGSNSQVVLSGQGVQPKAVLSPKSLDFGSVAQGSSTKSGGFTKGTQQVTLANTGSAPLNISGITTGAPAFSQSNNCPAALAAGASCIISVDFSPTAAQQYSSQLNLASDGAAGGDSAVALTGNGTAADKGGAFAPWLLLPGLLAARLRRRRRA